VLRASVYQRPVSECLKSGWGWKASLVMFGDPSRMLSIDNVMENELSGTTAMSAIRLPIMSWHLSSSVASRRRMSSVGGACDSATAVSKPVRIGANRSGILRNPTIPYE